MGKSKSSVIGWKAKYKNRSKDIATANNDRDKALKELSELEELTDGCIALFGKTPDEILKQSELHKEYYNEELHELNSNRDIIISTADAQALTLIESARKKSFAVSEDANSYARVIRASVDELSEELNGRMAKFDEEVDSIVRKKSLHLLDREKAADEFDEKVKLQRADIELDMDKIRKSNLSLCIRERNLKKDELLVADTMGDTDMKKLRVRLHARQDTVRHANKAAVEAINENNSLKVSMAELRAILNQRNSKIERLEKKIAELEPEFKNKYSVNVDPSSHAESALKGLSEGKSRSQA